MQTLDEQRVARPAGLFGAVLCVTGRSEYAHDAVRQAACVAGRGGELELLDIDRTSDDVEVVLRRSRGRGLLVLPAGPLAEAVLPRAEVPVLVARPAPGDSAFPGSVLIAVDGTPEAHAAVRLGARLAARVGTVPALVASPEHDAGHQSALQLDAAIVERIAGQRPLILDEHGSPVASILAAAASLESSLIVLGSRPGRPDGSVSAAVAAHAPRSVLVLRGVSRPRFAPA